MHHFQIISKYSRILHSLGCIWSTLCITAAVNSEVRQCQNDKPFSLRFSLDDYEIFTTAELWGQLSRYSHFKVMQVHQFTLMLVESDSGTLHWKRWGTVAGMPCCCSRIVPIQQAHEIKTINKKVLIFPLPNIIINLLWLCLIEHIPFGIRI